MKNEPEVSRDVIIDSLRGLGIILVVIAHVSGGFDYSNLSSDTIAFIGDYIDGFHMPLFFILAGYAHGMKERFSYGQRLWPYVKKSLTELYIPGLYFSLLYWLPKFFMLSNPAFAAENFRTVSFIDIFRIPVYGFNLYWFLFSLFFVKSIHMFFERYMKSESLHVIFWLLTYAIVIFTTEATEGFEFSPFLRDTANFLVRDEHYYFSVFYVGIYFHIGFLMKRHSFIPQKITTGIILFIIGTAFFTASHFYELRNIFTRTGTSISMTLALFIIFYDLNISNKILVTCGVYSMVIYCLHNYIIALCRVLFRLTGLSSSAEPLMLFVICALIAIIIPLMIVCIYKNVKCLRWIEYIFYPGRYKKSDKNPLP